jgi:TetR/AcrR family transcriptional regulator, cholesterol catabolism regulator
VTQPTAGAIPVTPAQQERYDRVIAAAEVLFAGGEEAVQMKDLAQVAGLSVATLYRYFPSKDYVLLAVSLARYQEAARKVFAKIPPGDSVRERVTDHLMREFRAQQRTQDLTVALTRPMNETSRSYSAILEAIEHLHLQIVRHVAAAGGSLSEQHEKLLPVVIDIFNAASLHWQAGDFSVSEAQSQIEVGCRLLELPDEVVDSALGRAAPDTRFG